MVGKDVVVRLVLPVAFALASGCGGSGTNGEAAPQADPPPAQGISLLDVAWVSEGGALKDYVFNEFDLPLMVRADAAGEAGQSLHLSVAQQGRQVWSETVEVWSPVRVLHVVRSGLKSCEAAEVTVELRGEAGTLDKKTASVAVDCGE